MKSNTNRKQLFTKALEREYDRFINERRQRDLKALRKRSSNARATRKGPDRSGY